MTGMLCVPPAYLSVLRTRLLSADVTFNRGDHQNRSLATKASGGIYWIHLELSKELNGKELNGSRRFPLTTRTCMGHFLALVVLHIGGTFFFTDAL